MCGLCVCMQAGLRPTHNVFIRACVHACTQPSLCARAHVIVYMWGHVCACMCQTMLK
jgi:hypothetical protein